PENPVPTMMSEPLWNTSAPLPSALKPCAAPDTLMVPPTVPVAAAARLIRFAGVPERLRVEPEATLKSVPVLPPIVRAEATDDCSVTFVLPEIRSCAIVWVAGTFVAVVVAPLLNCSTSLVAGARRVGVQLAPTVKSAEPVWFHAYILGRNVAVMLLLASTVT